MLSVAFAGERARGTRRTGTTRNSRSCSPTREAETDEAKRKPYIWEMQAMLNERGGALIPVFRDWLDAHNQKVGGHTPHGGFDMDNGWIMEDAWLKS